MWRSVAAAQKEDLQVAYVKQHHHIDLAVMGSGGLGMTPARVLSDGRASVSSILDSFSRQLESRDLQVFEYECHWSKGYGMRLANGQSVNET